MRFKKSLWFVYLLLFCGLAFAIPVSDDLHLNVELRDINGNIVTGNFDFVFNISNVATCDGVVYSHSANLDTDNAGRISYYLPDVSLDYDEQYYLCYYREGILVDTIKIARTPYTFRTRNATLSGVDVDSNFDLGSNNVSADTGFFGWIGSLAGRVSKLFVNDVDAVGSVNITGDLIVNETDVCLEDGTNCPVGAVDTHVAGDGDYLYNDSTTMYLNETRLNGTIDVRDTDTQKSAGGNYLYNDSVTIYFNETLLNSTIDARSIVASSSPWANNSLGVFLKANYPDRVGIGTSYPNASLHVINSINQDARSNFSVIGSYTNSTILASAFGLFVVGDYAYVTALVSGGYFSIFDISDKNNPTLISTLSNSSLIYSENLYVSGEYAYVMNENTDTFTIIEVADPTNPTIKGWVTNSTLLDGAWDVVVSGKYAYCVNAFDNRLTIIDISVPSTPEIVGTLKNDTLMNLPTAIAFSGRYAYVLGYSSSSIAVIDISDPTNPTIIGSYINSTYLFSAMDLVISDNFLYVSSETKNYMTILDVSDKTNPKFKSALDTSIFGSTSSYRIFVLNGKYAYLPMTNTNLLARVDVTNKSNPYFSGFASVGITPWNVFVSGDYGYVLTAGGGSLEVLDLGGSDFSTISSGNLKTGSLHVADDSIFSGGLDVKNGVTISGDVLAGRDMAVGGDLTVGGKEVCLDDGTNCLASSDTHVAGDGDYLYNDSTTMYLNETRLNGTIDARDTDTQKDANGDYLYNDSTTMYLNETRLNGTIDARDTISNETDLIAWTNDSNEVSVKAGYPQNVSFTGNLSLGQRIVFTLGETIDNLADGWVRITGGLNVTGGASFGGDVDFNGGWNNDGVSISGGDIFAQELYVYNVSSLDVNHLNVNGSMSPVLDNSFDIGNISSKWRDGYFSGTLESSAVNVGGISVCLQDGTNCPSGPVDTHVAGDDDYLYNDSTTIYLNETRLNGTIDARDTDTQKDANGDYLYNDSTTIYLNETRLNGTIDAREVDTHVAANGDYLYNDSTTMYLNETRLNGTIDARSGDTSPWTNNSDEVYIDGGYPQNVSFTGNLSLGQRIAFALGETIDNIVDGWARITGGLNVTENATIGGRLSVGTDTLNAGLNLPSSDSTYASLNMPNGNTPSSPNVGDIWSNGSNLYYYDGQKNLDLTVPQQDIVYVASLSDLPTQVGGKITLESKTYRITTPILYTPYTLVFPHNQNVNLEGNTIAYIGTGTFFEGNIGDSVVNMRDLLLTAPAGTVFNLTSNTTSGVFLLRNSVVSNFTRLGYASNLTFLTNTVNFVKGVFGIELSDNYLTAFITTGFSQWQNIGTSYISVTGFNGIIQISGCNFFPNSNEYIFNFTPTFTPAGVVSGNTIYPGAGQIFAPQSAIQNDTSWTFASNSYITDSTALIDTAISDSTDITVIAATSTPVMINGTWVLYDSERFILDSTGIFNYTGIEDIRVKVSSSVSMRHTGAANTAYKLTSYIAKNGQVVNRSEGAVAAEGGTGEEETAYSQTTLSLSTGDYVSIYVENEDSIDDIAVKDASVIISKI